MHLILALSLESPILPARLKVRDVLASKLG